MFNCCIEFNQSLNKWDISNVENSKYIHVNLIKI